MKNFKNSYNLEYLQFFIKIDDLTKYEREHKNAKRKQTTKRILQSANK